MQDNQQQPCTREDLTAILLVESSWGVSDDGSVDIADYHGDGDGDTDYIDYYKCENCCLTFKPKADSTYHHDDRAWQAALEHLKANSKKEQVA